jgi:regulation of enolase protein 1 (concanavalin A-like superfamily)
MLKRVASAIVLVLLLGCMLTSAKGVHTAESGPNAVFFDDFKDGNADGWTQNLGSWNVVNREYFVSVEIENAISTVEKISQADYMIEAKLRFDEASIGYKACVVFRYSDNTHYYAFEISNEYDSVALTRYTPTNPDYGIEFNSTGAWGYPIEPNENYSLKVIVHGTLFRCYIDGKEIVSGIDSVYSEGKVGLFARRADAFFDNFAVYSTRAKPKLPFSDNFNSKVLNARWTVVDPDGGSTFDLSVHRGWLRITTTSPPGRDLYANVQNAPHIIQSGISGDFTLETKIMATTVNNDEGAGLIVWKDSNTHLRFERISRTIGQPVQQQIILLVEGAGSGSVFITLSSDLNPTYLRLVRSGQSYSGYYSSDGATWQHAGDATFPVSDPVDIGLDVIHMYHSGTFFADFDYFKITTR